nr:nucleoside-diphosphate sugar epimerase/dehydratase [Maritimibacter dapengensis]
MHILPTTVALALAAGFASFLTQTPVPRSVPLGTGVFFFGLATTYRFLLANLIDLKLRYGVRASRAIIYGAGRAGMQLAHGLKRSSEMLPVMFVDDDPHVQHTYVSGMMVREPERLADLVQRYRIDRVLIAMPSASPERLKAIVANLSSLDAEIQVMPSFVDLILQGRKKDISLVPAEQLLGRSQVDLEHPHITKTYAGRSVMVTGAGGSIGSELCRQILKCAPDRLVMFDQSEFALYTLEMELAQLAKDANIDLIARLGSVTDPRRVRSIIGETCPDVILHAAAYKHVPIVEDNEVEGAFTNVLGTRNVALAAIEAGIERFVLVSTDKAVRPTNIMGATKRMAEMVLQDLATRSTRTKLSMVRFGNVLGSSGSVVPLFRRQIQSGGPVTVTHPEVTRYFMTVPEASRLVLLAGAYSAGGDVFVLDMGKPKRIFDIARRMIEMSGQTVRDPDTGKGDIEIQIVGLRPGEKLYEELLIGADNLLKTPHPLILRAEETFLSQIETASLVRELSAMLEGQDKYGIRDLVTRFVDGYKAPVREAVPAS